jgi:hypothetical protein
VEQGIEETDEQVFVHLCTEELLEAEVGIWVDVALFAGVNHILSCVFVAAKIVQSGQTSK